MITNQFNLSRWADNHLPTVDLVTSTAVLLLLWLAFRLTSLGPAVQGAMHDVRGILYGSASAICATLLGFIITAVTLIISLIQQTPSLAKFRQGKRYAQLHDVYFSAIRWMATAALAFLLLLFIDTDAHPVIVAELFGLWLGLLVIARLWRCLWVLEALVRASGEP